MHVRTVQGNLFSLVNPTDCCENKLEASNQVTTRPSPLHRAMATIARHINQSLEDNKTLESYDSAPTDGDGVSSSSAYPVPREPQTASMQATGSSHDQVCYPKTFPISGSEIPLSYLSDDLGDPRPCVVKHSELNVSESDLSSKASRDSNSPARTRRSWYMSRPKSLTCPQGCGKQFRTSHDLNAHIRSHTGERPYVCSHPGCGKAFAQAGSRSRHFRTHSGTFVIKLFHVNSLASCHREAAPCMCAL